MTQSSGGQVVMDPEELNRLITDIEVRLRKLRELGAGGFTSKPVNLEAHAFDLDGINWRIKGGAKATLDDSFAFDFTADRNGTVPPEKKELVEYLKKNNSLVQNGFTITLSKDGKFLNRSRR
jgi:hypothetical protein